MTGVKADIKIRVSNFVDETFIVIILNLRGSSQIMMGSAGFCANFKSVNWFYHKDTELYH